MKVADILRRLDAYPRTLEDFSVRTVSGAAVTIISTTIVIFLICLELYAYLTTNISQELFVDTTRGHKLRINMDITIGNLACNYLSLDAMDSSGDQHLRVDHHVLKHRLDLNGNPINEANPIKEIISVSTQTVTNKTCGSCYGAEQNSTQCCNTCDEVMELYRIKKWHVQLDKIEQCKDRVKRSDKEALNEGCRVQGHLEVNRMAGSFHIAPGNSFSIKQFHIHDFQVADVKLSHMINHLSFGDKIEFATTHPLDGLLVESDPATKSEMYNYYLKIVPTMYMRQNEDPIYTNQFSVTRYRKDLTDRERGMPGIFFSYELSPLMVRYIEKSRSFGHFATNCCSIIGGVFTVAGMIASFLNNSLEVIKRKFEIGKLS